MRRRLTVAVAPPLKLDTAAVLDSHGANSRGQNERMRVGWVGALAIATATGIAGCQRSGDAAQASCTFSGSVSGVSLTVCEEVEGVTQADLGSLGPSCGIPPMDLADGGAESSPQFMYGPCSRDGTIGGCRKMSGSVIITQWYYDDGTGRLTPPDVQMACTVAGDVFVQR
jgi:hypothetical protein